MRQVPIISMGGSCTLSYNLRRYFQQELAYPFDWWISPLAAVTELLNDPNPDKIYNRAACELIRDKSGEITSIRNNEIGIMFPHDVPLTEQYYVHFENAKYKLQFLFTRLFELNKTKAHIAFVREFIAQDVRLTPADIQDYLNTCESVFASAQITHYFINYPKPIPGVSQISIDRPAGAPWFGDGAAWDGALSGLQESLERATL